MEMEVLYGHLWAKLAWLEGHRGLLPQNQGTGPREGRVADQERRALAALAAMGDLTQARLAEVMRHHQKRSRFLYDRLEARGLVTVREGPKGARIARITPEGRAYLEGVPCH